MIILLKHILRNIYENKFRSALIVLSLMLSTMVIYLNFVIKDDISIKYKSVLQGTYQNYDFMINKDNASNKFFTDSELNYDHLNINKVLYVNKSYGTFNYNDEAFMVCFYGSDRQALLDGKLIVIEEKINDFNSNDDKQIVISKKIAEKYSIKLGDEISVNTVLGKEALKVSGIAKDQGIFLSAGDNILFTTSKEYVEKLLSNNGKSEFALVDIKDGMNIEDSMNKFKSNNKEFITNALVDQKTIEQTLNMANQILIIMLLAVIVLNFYVISSITKLILAARIPVIGTFRSVGATKNKVNGILILENVVYGAIGGILGIVLAALVRNPVSNLFVINADTVMNGSFHPSFNIKYAFFAISISILLQLFITIKSILKSSRIPIKDTIFNTLSTKTKISGKTTTIGIFLTLSSVILYISNTKYNIIFAAAAFIAAISGAVLLVPILTKYLSKVLAYINGKLFGSAVELGAKNLTYSKTITSSVTLVTVALSIMLMIYMMSLSLNGVFGSAKELFKSDIHITGLSESREAYEKLKEVHGVESIDYLYYSADYYIDNNIKPPVVVSGFNVSKMGVKDISGLIGKLNNNEALIDEYFAIKNNIKIGDEIALENKNTSNKSLNYKVVGFVDSTMFTMIRNVLVINEKNYVEKVSEVPATIEVSISKDLDDMKTTLLKELTGKNVMIQTVKEYLKLQQNQTSGLVLLVGIILGFSVVLAILGLINNQLIGFIQRKKEYAILYSVSMSKAQLRKMILFEVFGTFTVGCLLGTALSMWLKYLLESLMFSIGIFLRVTVNINSIIMMLVVVFTLLSLTALSPMRRISKMDIVREIKYE